MFERYAVFRRGTLVKMQHTCLFLLCIGFLSISAAFAAEFSLIVEPEGQQAVIQHQKAEATSPFRAAVRWRRVDLLKQVALPDGIAKGDELVLNLFPDITYHATIDRVSVNVQGTITVRGRLRDYPLGYLLISTTDDVSLATIRVPELGVEYRIVYDPDSRGHYLLDQDPANLDTLEGAPAVLPPPPKPEEQLEIKALQERIQLNQASPDSLIAVDVLAVYTPAARNWAITNEGSISNTIAQAMAKGQLAADNSGVLLTVNLVHSAEVPYTENGDSAIDLDRLQNPTDGYLDTVHAFRSTYGADLVVLFENVNDVGGIGYLLKTPSGEPAYGFSITRVQQASWTYTTIHEIGHNMGLGHHKRQDSQPGPGLYLYSAGWRWISTDGMPYCSVMTYESGDYFTDRINHTRVAYFSNPNITYLGTATGHPTDGDNARTVRETKAVVAAYGQAMPSCTITISPTSALFGSSASAGSVTVTASTGSCAWTAVSNAAWITITAGSAGTGNGTVSYSASANATGSTRSGTMTIGGQTFTVTQNGASLLYFPHVATTLPWRTEIAVINTSATQTVTGTLRGFSNTGQLRETLPVTLPPRGRTQIIVAERFADHASIGYFVFEASSGTIQGYTKFYQEGKYRAAIPAVKEVTTSDIYIPHIASNDQWWTGIGLLNTTAAAKVVTITFNTGQRVQRTLTANQHDAFTIRDLFAGQPQPDITSAVITGANGVIGLELFGSSDDSNQLDGILLTDNPVSTLYYPHVAGDGWWTGVVAYNPSDLAATVTITPYNIQGGRLTPKIDSIAGKGTYVHPVSELGLPPDTVWFRMNSTQPLVGFELFGTGTGTAKQVAAYGGGGIGSTTGVFPKLEKNGGWTGIAFVNTTPFAASVTLTACTDAGTPVTAQGLTLPGRGKEVRLAEDFFTEDISSATYIFYSSDWNVVGLQINGSGNGMLLDGLSALAD